ncbi:pyroglutamyl-peptidase I [Microbacterium sp. 3H14]|uniref:pyroglutamyl-peptidase I family protein n=1 Tax=unclassified Microbacterium TaxID=2609290 RepID=UPI001069C614|nr:pyroglutamyl-peptidase I [Microbacterium sp. 3H14]TFB17762.1 pyroglutamyl-peptidase I [Microbacterium sp. 3H14]
MAVILLTGFEPFDGAARNPSADAVRAVAADYDGPHDLVIATLPVAFDASALRLRDLIATHSPDAVIATGLAGGSQRIAVERIGVNLIDARIPDNDGAQPFDAPSEIGGPAARFASLPTKRLFQVLIEEGLPAHLSLSAGTYVCNHVLYTALGSVRADARAGFVHLPWSTSTAPAGAAHLADKDLARAVRLVVDHALDAEVTQPGGSLW